MRYEQLDVKVFPNRRQMGDVAAEDVAKRMKQVLSKQEEIRMVFAAAPSQNEFLQALATTPGIDWSRVIAFHMDEYIGLSFESPQRFSHFLQDRLFNSVRPRHVNLIDCSSTVDVECARYGKLLTEAPIDIICLGIGENGHIAFNDPPVADFNDPFVIKAVELDAVCRQQQVNDGCFPDVSSVPTHALTLTIPTMMSGKHLFCIVPGPTKREAVSRMLHEPITAACPASILRTHPDCTLYVDADSYEERKD